jgi:hypothetical protein
MKSKVKLKDIQKYINRKRNKTIEVRCIDNTDIVDSISWFDNIQNKFLQGQRLYIHPYYNLEETIEAIKNIK